MISFVLYCFQRFVRVLPCVSVAKSVPSIVEIDFALRTATALLALAIPGLVAGAPAPQTVSATYIVYMNGAHVADMNETFEARDRSYRIVSESAPAGALALFQKPATVVSNGNVTPQGLRPERFEGRRIGSRQVKAEFDWA